VDELAVSGGLVGAPIRLVKCKTVPLEAPAEAEIVIEGYINTEFVEPEGPFGESHGYMHPRQLNPFMDVTAITHRRDAIYVSWISQVTPSESSVIKKRGCEMLFMRHLRDECRIKSVARVEMHEPLTNLRKFILPHPAVAPGGRRALHRHGLCQRHQRPGQRLGQFGRLSRHDPRLEQGGHLHLARQARAPFPGQIFRARPTATASICAPPCSRRRSLTPGCRT